MIYVTAYKTETLNQYLREITNVSKLPKEVQN